MRPQSRFNQSEALLELQCNNRQWEFLRAGWPDYLVIAGDELLFTEVKGVPDKSCARSQLMPNQITLLTLLYRLGLPIYIVPEGDLDKRFPFIPSDKEIEDSETLIKHLPYTIIATVALEKYKLLAKLVRDKFNI